jgi:hypothetical protein
MPVLPGTNHTQLITKKAWYQKPQSCRISCCWVVLYQQAKQEAEGSTAALPVLPGATHTQLYHTQKESVQIITSNKAITRAVLGAQQTHSEPRDDWDVPVLGFRS